MPSSESKKRLKILGITGNIGCGKTTVLQYLQGHYKAFVLELDRVAAKLQEKGGSCYEPMIQILGEQIIGPDGELDRKKAAAIMFADERLVKAVNEAVHPKVKAYILETIQRLSEDKGGEDASLLVIESALLLDDDYDRICDEVWYIYADDAARTERLMASRGYTKEKIRSIMASQKDEAFFRAHVDVVIDNTGDDPDMTLAQVDREIDRFLSDPGDHKKR